MKPSTLLLSRTIRNSLIFLAIFLITLGAIFIPYMKYINASLSPSISRLMMDITSFIPSVIAGWMMIKYIDKETRKATKADTHTLLIETITGLLIGLSWITLSYCLQFAFGTIKINESANSLQFDFLIYATALLINAASQEFLFRGYLFRLIQHNHGFLSALFTTSLLFMFIHAGALAAGIIPSLNVFGAGVIFGLTVKSTGRIWTAIAIHFSWNFLYSSVLYKPIAGYQGLHLYNTTGSELLAGGQNGVEATIITSVTIVVIVALQRYYLKLLLAETHEEYERNCLDN